MAYNSVLAFDKHQKYSFKVIECTDYRLSTQNKSILIDLLTGYSELFDIYRKFG